MKATASIDLLPFTAHMAFPVVRIKAGDFVCDYSASSLLRDEFQDDDFSFPAEELGVSTATVRAALRSAATLFPP